ncbi:MAG: SseB family protein [Oscillospiraceae bacterium]
MANQFTTNELKNFNKPLEERITAAVADQSKWKDVLPDLMAADVFVVAQISDRVDDKGNKLLNLLTMTNKEGQQAVPFFTSPQKMSVLATPERKQINCMKMNTVKLFQAIKGKIALLNPGSPDCAKMFTPFEMNLLVMENLDKQPKNDAPKAE